MGKKPMTIEQARALDEAGFAVVPKADLALLYHLHRLFVLRGEMESATLDAAREAAKSAELNV